MFFLRLEAAISIATWGLVLAAVAVQAEIRNRAERWYSPDQAVEGKALYQIHCSGCHGIQGEAGPHWNRPGPDGRFPPPPLNGTGHTWHHQLPLLRRIIREGGIGNGGQMPGFHDKLSDRQIDALIAGFQSRWSDEIYRKWDGSGFERIPQPPVIEELLRGLD